LAIPNGAQTLVFIVASKSCGAIEERLAHLLARGVVDEDGE
jgi:hypothetical protein